MWRALALCLALTSAAAISVVATAAPTAAEGLSGGTASTTQTDDGFLPVGEAYKPQVEASENGLTVIWDIADHYYLYRHGFKFELRDQHNKLDVIPAIPAGERKKDDYFGEVEVYHQQVVITLNGVPATRPLWLKVSSQGCAEGGLCYPPYHQYFEIDAGQGSKLIPAAAFQQITTPSGGARPPQAPDDDATTPVAAAGSSASPTAPAALRISLPAALLFAFLGGIILNLMPCVFPVLSLKLLSFAGKNPHLAHTRMHGIVYSIGVIASFLAVATLLLFLRASGEAIGWGFHLQSPWFVAILTYLFLVMALALGGMLEIGTRLMGLGGGLASQGGYGGSFFTGVLAVVVASPCSAPFMGSALGFAITQPPLTSLAIFASLGAGMAAPFLLLSSVPSLLRFMPKPGAWMDRFKRFMAFPMLLTCVWLLWVLGNQTSASGMALVLAGCLLLALAVWLHNEPIEKPLWKATRRATQWGGVVVAFALLASPTLQPVARNVTVSADYEAYTSERLQQLLAAGQPVFIDATADWCITCLTNEQVTLDKPEVRSRMKEKVVFMKADWTNEDPAITALLQQYGRSGVPLYLLYDGKNPVATVLPQLLTPGLVLEALDKLPSKQVAAQ
jgi:thiol:disulfide interchange protein DsbD